MSGNAVWRAPEWDVVKINCDAAVSVQRKRGYIAVIARDPAGRVLGGMNREIRQDNSLVLEALAVKDAFLLAEGKGWEQVTVESDSSEVVRQVKSLLDCRDWILRPIIDEILRSQSLLQVSSVQHAKRGANKAADWIDSSMKKGVCNANWVANPPPPLLEILLADVKCNPP